MHILTMVYHGILWESMEKCKIFNIFLLFYVCAVNALKLRVSAVDKAVNKIKKSAKQNA